MIAHTHQKWFQELVEAEGLADYRRFLRDDFFDEIPFYSRYQQLDAIDSNDVAEINRQLIELCLVYLNELLSAHAASGSLFAAITLIHQGRNRPILPSLFACHGASVPHVLENLSLSPPTSRFAGQLRQILRNSNLDSRFSVLQDEATTPGQPRYFLVPKFDPDSLTVCLDHLAIRSAPRDNGHHSPNLESSQPAGIRHTK